MDRSRRDMEELKHMIQKHISDESVDVKKIQDVLFGNESTGEKGMIQKVNEMYEMLTQARGVRSLLGIVMLIGAAIGALTVIKTFFYRI